MTGWVRIPRWCRAVIAVTVLTGGASISLAADGFAAARDRMVRDDVAAAGVTDPRVLDSMRTTPRHEFVPMAHRKQAYLDMVSRSPALEEDADHMTAMLDAGLRVQTGRFLQTSISEMQADAAAKKAIKLAQEAADLLERPPLKEKPPKRKLSEAERLVAHGQARRTEAARQQRIAICKAVIIKGGAPNASKEARADARRAVVELDGLMGQER